MDILELLQKAVELKASDLHITVGRPPLLRINGELRYFDTAPLTPEDTKEMTKNVLNDEQFNALEEKGELDLSFIMPKVSRFRLNVYKQRSSFCMAFRIIWVKVPTLEELGFPETLMTLSMKPRGLIIVTGPTGSGKSTTLAAMVNHINSNRNCHVLTLEDPIEYIHKHNKSMINQREIGTDTKNYASALRAALRQDPDVILVGEMRDLETISTAITAAETGHLVLSTLHTTGAAQTIDRIIDVFPPFQQQQVRAQLAGVLEGVISQQLIPSFGGRVAALEIMISNNAINNLIREGKVHQISSVLQTNIKSGMKSMDYSLAELVKAQKITVDDAYARCVDIEMLKRYLM